MAAATAPRTPVGDVRNAIAAGATSRTDIARRTGLAPSTVDAAIDFLERTGRLRREHLESCPGGTCTSCPLANVSPSGDACCGLDHGRGPVALVLSPTRHR